MTPAQSIHEEKQRRHGKLEAGDRQSVTQISAERDRFAMPGAYASSHDIGRGSDQRGVIAKGRAEHHGNEQRNSARGQAG